MVVTGALLFYAIPVKTYLNIFFRMKVTLPSHFGHDHR